MDTNTLTPLVRPSGKDYAGSVIGLVEAGDMDLKDAEFDLRALLKDPNSKVSDENRKHLREVVASCKETIRKIEVEAEL